MLTKWEPPDLAETHPGAMDEPLKGVVAAARLRSIAAEIEDQLIERPAAE